MRDKSKKKKTCKRADGRIERRGKGRDNSL